MSDSTGRPEDPNAMMDRHLASTSELREDGDAVLPETDLLAADEGYHRDKVTKFKRPDIQEAAARGPH